MKNKLTLLVLLFPILLYSCDLLNMESVAGDPTTDEIVSGLKTALKVGTDSSSTVLNKQDGYFANAAIKIPMPPEAKLITDNMNGTLLSSIGVPAMVEKMVLSMNRSAEDAASEAKPIFWDAITNITLGDALSILQGKNPSSPSSTFDSTAATGYLKSVTYTALSGVFQPKIDVSLGRPLVSGLSANSLWTTLTTAYNNVANTLAGRILGLSPVTSQLSLFVTQKGLDGLFHMVGIQEKKIRKDPFKWASDILKKVFGFVYKP